MSSLNISLNDLYSSYKKWVSTNPLKVGDFEFAAKYISYFLAGRINNSHVLTELVYCLSNLLVLINDRIISKAQKLEIPAAGDRIKLCLTVLEYCEVFFELSAQSTFGTRGKWIIIVAIQVFKFVSRALLLYHYKENVIQQPPIPVLQRINAKPQQESDASCRIQREIDTISFNLRRSGKLVRKIDASPPVNLRSWKPVEKPVFDNNQSIEKALKGQQLIAETIYICKPIAHLCTIACFGHNTWKPWMVSLMIDFTSLYIYNKLKNDKNCLNEKQKLEISRRYVALLLYLLKSPFYEKYSKQRISSFLQGLSKKLSILAVICQPLDNYIPFWQSKYFYLWST